MQDVVEKVKYLCKFTLQKYDQFLKDIESTEEELIELYKNDTPTFNKIIFNHLICVGEYLNPLLIKERDFLENYSPKARNYLEHEILRANKVIPGWNDYSKWENKEYEKEEFDIDTMIEIMNALDRPKLPLTRYFFNDENKYDKYQIINGMMNESSYKALKSCQELFKLIINGEIKGDFKITCSDKEIWIHSWIVNQYKTFDRIFGTELTLDYDFETVKIMIEWLYTGRFEYENLDDEILSELYEISDYLILESLRDICELLLDTTDLKNKYRIEKQIEHFIRWTEKFNDGDISEDMKNNFIEAIKEGNYTEILNLGRVVEITYKEKYPGRDLSFGVIFSENARTFLYNILGFTDDYTEN